jgi:hypothetical protein
MDGPQRPIFDVDCGVLVKCARGASTAAPFEG